MPIKVEEFEGPIHERKEEGEGEEQEWGSAMEIHGCDGVPDPIPGGQANHLQPAPPSACHTPPGCTHSMASLVATPRFSRVAKMDLHRERSCLAGLKEKKHRHR